jgi:hypothetical protein
MNGFSDNPYAVLTLIVAPAVLTNACSVMALSTSNRFARAVDRQRQLSTQLEAGRGCTPLDPEAVASRRRQLRRTEVRAQLLLKAMTRFYAGLGAFASATLVSLLGALAVPTGHSYLAFAATVLALGCGVAGVGGLVWGGVLLVRETRVALQALREEAEFSLKRSGPMAPAVRGVSAEEEGAAGEEPLDEATER